jgi:aspartyl-tRNA(Asn)/glutamyl-tRNA(Gln) amidotransferase subunit A
MLMPASPTLPFRLGEKLDDPLAMYLSDIFTIGANLAGTPGVSCPAGASRDGLPIGIQVLGPEDSEPLLLRAARALEVRGERAALGRAHETEFTWPTKR